MNQCLAAQARQRRVPKNLTRLVHASLFNQFSSHLIRLPDSVLVAIMALLSLDDMAKLRHVSREFMRLFDRHPLFQQYHAKNTSEPLRSAPWAVPDPSVFFAGQAVSAWKPLCRECAEVRQGDDSGKKLLLSMPRLYCSGCNKSHRIMYFSAKQRAMPNDGERACLGHEACLTFDGRIIVSWRQAVAMSQHQSTNSIAFKCSTAAQMCSERSCSFKPSVRASFTSLDGGKMRMAFTQTLHFPFKRQASGKVSANDVLNSIKAIPIIDGSGSPLDTMCFEIFRAFDPNICSCVDWGQSDVSYWSFTGRKFDLQMAAPPRGPSRRPLSHGYEGRQGRCLGRQHGFSTECATGQYEMDIYHCTDDANMLVVQARMTSIVESASDPAWLCSLNFNSCQYINDPEMRGIVWCRDSNCGVAKAYVHRPSVFELEWKYNL